jgi:hypothetical protein
MSIPPAADAMITGFPCARSRAIQLLRNIRRVPREEKGSQEEGDEAAVVALLGR